jgi:hypothetical protein
MPSKSHHRSRSSVDQVLGLLADLPEHQIALLLDDFNHTTSSNVPVSKAIAIFDPSVPKPKRIFDRSSSPVRTLEAELVRRHSKRISSAPQPSTRPNVVSQQLSATPTPISRITTTPEPRLPPLDRPNRPSLALSPPETFERPQTADPPAHKARTRSYKRISRPLILSPTAKAELHELLLAYLSETPASATSTATPSPVTPNAAMPFSLFAPVVSDSDIPGLDLLEPSPTRTPHVMFGGRKAPADSMSGIFEILASH